MEDETLMKIYCPECFKGNVGPSKKNKKYQECGFCQTKMQSERIKIVLQCLEKECDGKICLRCTLKFRNPSMEKKMLQNEESSTVSSCEQCNVQKKE